MYNKDYQEEEEAFCADDYEEVEVEEEPNPEYDDYDDNYNDYGDDYYEDEIMAGIIALCGAAEEGEDGLEDLFD